MKTGKQFLALTLGLLLVLGLFAGCQQEKAPATEPSTEPVTEAPTEAPTEEPTEAPTEATEPATEPEDAVTNVFLQEPEGFFVDTTTGFLRAPGFPDDMSYISVIPTPQNTAVLDMSAEQYEAAMKLSLAAMGQDAEATVESVEMRTRTVTETDPETGEETTREEEYEYHILIVLTKPKLLHYLRRCNCRRRLGRCV